jgi:hypothetical protein
LRVGLSARLRIGLVSGLRVGLSARLGVGLVPGLRIRAVLWVGLRARLVIELIPRLLFRQALTMERLSMKPPAVLLSHIQLSLSCLLSRQMAKLKLVNCRSPSLNTLLSAPFDEVLKRSHGVLIFLNSRLKVLRLVKDSAFLDLQWHKRGSLQ